MANQLSKTGIQNSQTIQAWHVTQSIDALTAAEAYDITISGSLTLTGSVSSLNGFTGNLVGTASRATEAGITTQVRPSNTVSDFGYTLPYLSGTGSLATMYYSATGPTYNPTSDKITVGKLNSEEVVVTGSVLVTGSITTDYIQFNTSSDIPGAPGQMWWNEVDGTANLRLKGNNVTLQIGEESVTRIYNATGGPLNENEYRVVYVSGADTLSGTLKGYLAQSDDINTVETTLGIVTETILPDQTGYITTRGLVRNINTSMFAAGDVLYLSGTVPGGLTNQRVSPPNLDVIVGYVVVSDPNGSIYVDVRSSYEYPQYISVSNSGSITGSAGTAYTVTYNTASYSSAAYLDNNSRLYVSKPGLYDLQYTAQINRFGSSGTATVSIWLKKEGTNVPLTNRDFISTGNTGTANTVGTSNYHIFMESGSYVELAWSTDDADVGMQGSPAAVFPTRPSTPSISVTLNRVG